MADKLENQICPVCQNASLTLVEDEQEVPYFGKVLIFSLKCSNCDFLSSDVECKEQKEPSRYVIVIDSEKDMNIRVVKSSNATIKVPQLKLSVEPGPASIGYVSNIEGILERFKEVLEAQLEMAEEHDDRKKIKNILKKIWKARLGDLPLKIILEDPSGNSAIISEKAKIERLRVRK